MGAIFHNLGMQRKKFRELMGKNFGPDDRKKVLLALKFAERKHKGQRRNIGTAYVIHPLRVASILLDEVGTWDADVVVAALLHDVVEDCGVRVKTIQKRFGRRVASFVKALTRPRFKHESEIEKEQHKKRKLQLLASAAYEVRLIKCADILDNLRSAADVSAWQWTPLIRRKFPRWHREFQFSARFAKEVHLTLYREIQRALRIFELKRIVRGMVRFGF